VAVGAILYASEHPGKRSLRQPKNPTIRPYSPSEGSGGDYPSGSPKWAERNRAGNSVMAAEEQTEGAGRESRALRRSCVRLLPSIGPAPSSTQDAGWSRNLAVGSRGYHRSVAGEPSIHHSIHNVRVQTQSHLLALPWESAQEFLARCIAAYPTVHPLVTQFRAVGVSRPVDLTDLGDRAFALGVIELT
jgi:hypothetical protein